MPALHRPRRMSHRLLGTLGLVVALAGTLALSAGQAVASTPSGAAPTAASPATAPGRMHLGHARIVTSCNSKGQVVRTKLYVRYDARELVGSIALTSSLGQSANGFTSWEAPGPDIATVLPGKVGVVSRLVTFGAPQAADPKATLIFQVGLRQNGFAALSLQISAPRTCGTTDSLVGPDIRVSAPDCAGDYTVVVDASKTTQSFTPAFYDDGGFRQTASPVKAGDTVTYHRSLGTATSTRLDAVALAVRASTGFPSDAVHGVTIGLSRPTDGSCA